jgi:peptide/nickel transport system permease protein
MIGWVIRRVLRAGTTLLGTTFILFVLVRVVPADPAVSIAGPKADPETLAAIRKDLGLDDPVAVQYGRYLWRLAHGDLGRSYMNGRRVQDVIRDRVPATALLAGTSLAFGFLLGLVVGIATAARRGSAIDVAVLVGTLVGLSIPTFWLGNLLIYQFSYRLRLLPLGGYTPLPWPPWPPGAVVAALPDFGRHLVLPAATLAIVEFFFYARFVHTNVAGTLASDYIRTARAKGASPARIYFLHALRNALIPIVTLLGLDIAALMSGVVLTETVFNWPGLGRLAVQAVFDLDIPLVAGTVLFSAVLVLAANLVVDLLYGVIDPRVQHG